MTYVTDISPDVLDAGHWVPGRWGVRRWVAAPTELDAEPAPGDIACPTCNAAVDDWCRRETGRVREPHPQRETERTCACGAPPLSRKSRYCEPCRAEVRKATWRAAEQRKRDRRHGHETTGRLLDAEAAMYGGAA